MEVLITMRNSKNKMSRLSVLFFIIVFAHTEAGWSMQDSIRTLVDTLESTQQHDIVFPQVLVNQMRKRRNVHTLVSDNEVTNHNHTYLMKEKTESMCNQSVEEPLTNRTLNQSSTEDYGNVPKTEGSQIHGDSQRTSAYSHSPNEVVRDQEGKSEEEEEITVIAVKDWILEIKNNPALQLKNELEAEWTSSGEKTRVETNTGCILQTGSVRGATKSIVALTTCDVSPIDSSGTGDMTGLIYVDGYSYFIQPLISTGGINRLHPHLIFRSKSNLTLGNDEDFENQLKSEENEIEEGCNSERRKRESHWQYGVREVTNMGNNTPPHNNNMRENHNEANQSVARNRALLQRIKKKLDKEEVGFFLDPLWEKDIEQANRWKEFTVNAPKRWLELALAIDHTVIRFHGRERVQQYVLSLMNIVSAIYKDPSLGANLQLVIVRMIFFEDENDSKVVDGHSKRSLENVNSWNENLNGDHDVAVWLTRSDLGGPSGYAPVSGACDPTRSCTLNRDEGLTSAFIIAHEVAHVLGLTHDGDLAAGNDCLQEAIAGSVMAPMVSATFHRFSWSSCSRKEFHTKAAQWKCLANQPKASNATELNSTLGATYSMDEQCRMEFGDGYSLCRTLNLPDPCNHLWCGHYAAPLVCKTKKGPPLEGTECGVNQWCIDGYCELVDHRRFRFDPVTHNRRDGGWSEWSEWTSCSRSCGIGVTFRTRACDNPKPDYGGADCVGKSEEFQICGQKPCPEPLKDFRAQQCFRLPTLIPIVGLGHRVNNTWLPHEADANSQKCQLTCVSKETGEVFMSGENLVDGTPCSYDRYDKSICIQGHCQPLGCDGVLDSKAKEDSCGVCNGDNSKCRNITNTFDRKLRRPMTRIAVFPHMARNVWIDVHTTVTHDYDYDLVNLALRDRKRQLYRLTSSQDWKFRRGGPIPIYGSVTVWTVPSNKKKNDNVTTKVVVEGTKFHYKRNGNHERLTARGPLLAELVLSVSAEMVAIESGVTVNTRSGYTLHESVLGAASRYVWQTGGWGPCSKSCGGGRRHKTMACRDTESGQLVSRKLCSLVAKPKTQAERCNLISCDFTWVPADWEGCTATCGSRGVQEREVFCVHNRSDPNELPWKYMVHPEHCKGVKPENFRPCNRVPCPAYWIGGNWSQCSTTCGNGFETREFRCPAPRGEPFFECGPSPPDEHRSCHGKFKKHEPECYKPRPCHRDASTYCRLTHLLGRYCVIPQFKKLCCKSCTLYLNLLPE